MKRSRSWLNTNMVLLSPSLNSSGDGLVSVLRSGRLRSG
jgi:hypothetical protein